MTLRSISRRSDCAESPARRSVDMRTMEAMARNFIAALPALALPAEQHMLLDAAGISRCLGHTVLPQGRVRVTDAPRAASRNAGATGFLSIVIIPSKAS